MNTQSIVEQLMAEAKAGADRDIKQIQELSKGMFCPSEIMEKYGLSIETLIHMIMFECAIPADNPSDQTTAPA